MAKSYRTTKEDLEEMRRIRAEQDAAYEASIASDREKARRRRLLEEQHRKEVQRKETLKQQKTDFLARLKPEPTEAKADETVTLVAVLPCGKRITRKFLRSDSLSQLFYFIFCDTESPDEFDVMTNYPKKLVPCRPPDCPMDPIDTATASGDECPDDCTAHAGSLGLDVGATFEEFGLIQNQLVFLVLP